MTKLNKNYLIGFTIIMGALVFFVTVIILHIIQTNYNLVGQLMSELALGKGGSFMLLAFSSIAISVFSVQVAFHQYQTSYKIRGLLLIASFSLLGAGIFHLANYPDIHISLVSVAFFLIVLAMYLLPKSISPFKIHSRKLISWILGFSTAISVASGNNVIPLGISQRLAAMCVLIWLIWFAFTFIYDKKLKKA